MEEVHLWLGSAEQRALRSQLARSGQFAYFNQQLDYPDWSRKAVFDFGGNAGNRARRSDPRSTMKCSIAASSGGRCDLFVKGV
jgi:hypothetical protein